MKPAAEGREPTRDDMKLAYVMARVAIKPYADAGKVAVFKDGVELAPGMTAIAALSLLQPWPRLPCEHRDGEP